MADFNCPDCGKALSRKARRDGGGYFWSCAGYPDCRFIADDLNDEPYLHKCPECGERLHVRIAKKSGNPFVACFNKESHASGDAIFFNEDGTMRGDDSGRPRPKGEFSCPECGKPLVYFRYKKGQRAGQMGFACFNEEGHSDGRPRFYEDNDGRPVM